MKVGDLNMHCGECDIIDFCNDYEDTPPCAQSRFENVTVSEYLNTASTIDFSECKTKNDIVNKIYEVLEESK